MRNSPIDCIGTLLIGTNIVAVPATRGTVATDYHILRIADINMRRERAIKRSGGPCALLQSRGDDAQLWKGG
jgi:hypothetical protein